MLVSITKHGTWINVAMNQNQNDLRKLRKKEMFFCPECQEEVILKIGTKRISHFAHKKGSSCTESYERESEYHLQGKLQLYKWLQTQGVKPVLEQYEQTISQRPDISFVYNGCKYVVEYQCTPIPTQLFMKRTITYKKANLIPIWILGGKNINRKGFSRASLSSFDYLFLRKTSSEQWFLSSFCPVTNHLITLKQIMPISIKNALTQFSVINIAHAKLTDLFEPDVKQSSMLNSWRTEIIKWKNTAAHYGTPNNKFLQELYVNSIIPSLLPPAIGLPVTNSPYIETPPIQWQSYIFIDILKQKHSISLGEIIQLFNNRIRKQEISIRKLPLSQKYNYETAIKEYLDLLVRTNIVQKVNNNRFKMICPLLLAENQIEQDEMEQNFYSKYGNIIQDSLNNIIPLVARMKNPD